MLIRNEGNEDVKKERVCGQRGSEITDRKKHKLKSCVVGVRLTVGVTRPWGQVKAIFFMDKYLARWDQYVFLVAL